MKKFIIILSILLSVGMSANAQNTDTPLRVVIPEDTGITPEAAQYLQNRLMWLVTGNATGVEDYGTSQFMITAKTFTESKDVVGSAPTMYAMNIAVTLYIADWVNDQLHSSMTFNARGVGESETKAYINAFRRMNINDPKIKAFINDGRNRIIHYYTTQGAVIIQKARMLASQRDYEQALFLLAAIPSSCGSVYNDAQSAMLDVYKKYVNYRGEKLLAQARSIWTATQNREGAADAAALLAEIDPEASCYKSADNLMKEIGSRIGEEWTLEKKAYNDAVALEKQRIDAARQVGVAYGNNQQPNTTNLLR